MAGSFQLNCFGKLGNWVVVHGLKITSHGANAPRMVEKHTRFCPSAIDLAFLSTS